MAFDRTAPAILVGVRQPGKSDADPFDLEGRVISFKFDDDEKKADKGTLVLDNFDHTLFEERNIVPGTILDITWGYDGLFSQTQTLVVKSIKGGPKLSVVCEGKKQLMNREHDNRAFENMTYADIANELATENGFRADQIFVDATEPKFETVVQARMTGAQFLRHLANKIGFEWYIDTDGFHFHERKLDQDPVRKFIYYNDPSAGDVLSYSIEEKSNNKAGKVTTKGRDPSTKETHESSSDNASDTEGKSTTEFVSGTGGVGLTRVTANKPAQPADNVSSTDTQPTAAASAEAGKAVARGRYRRSSVNAVKLTLTCIGDPEVTAKSVIEIAGIGKSFSGLYYVEKASHNIASGGYKMTLTCKRRGRNSGVSGAAGDRAGGKVNKGTAPDKKSDQRKPETVFVTNADGTGLKETTVYKDSGKGNK